MIKTQVAGITFRIKENPSISEIRPKGEVTLVADPENKFDKKAIKVMYEGIHIGFIPKGEVQEAVLEEFKAQRAVIAKIETFRCMDTSKGQETWTDGEGSLQSITLQIDLHTGYMCEGKQYKSITKLLSYLNPSGNFDGLIRWMFQFGSYDEYESKLSELADKGTELHKSIEDMFLGKKTNSEAIQNFRDKYSPEVISMEEQLFDDELGIAGTYDALFNIDGKKILIDWKSSKKVQLKHKIQVSFYSKLAKADEAWVVCFGGKTKQGYSLSKVSQNEIQDYYKVVEHLKYVVDIL